LIPATHPLGEKHPADYTRDEVCGLPARLRRAQEAALAARPYAKELVRVLRSTMARIESPQHPLLAKRAGRADPGAGALGGTRAGRVRSIQTF